MAKDKRDLLLKDLCCRLPYGVKLQHVKNADSIVELYSIDLDDFYCKIKFYTYKGKALTVSEEGKLLRPGGILRYKPYLFPLSSMTEDQRNEYNSLKREVPVFHYEYGDIVEEVDLCETVESIDYLYKNHFDCNDLIPLGLADDSTGKNIY